MDKSRIEAEFHDLEIAISNKHLRAAELIASGKDAEAAALVKDTSDIFRLAALAEMLGGEGAGDLIVALAGMTDAQVLASGGEDEEE
jgi:hypothetical protein